MPNKYSVTVKLVGVMTSHDVVAATLEDALIAGRKIGVPDIIGKHDWIDGDLEVVGVDEC